MPDYLPGEGTWTNPSAPPGPIGWGPGFFAWDPLSAQWRPSVAAPAGGYEFAGENAGDQANQPGRPAGADPGAGFRQLSAASRAASPHYNPQLALQFAQQNPGALGGHFNSNMDILGLAQGLGYRPGGMPGVVHPNVLTHGAQTPDATILPIHLAPLDTAEARARHALLSRLAG